VEGPDSQKESFILGQQFFVSRHSLKILCFFRKPIQSGCPVGKVAQEEETSPRCGVPGSRGDGLFQKWGKSFALAKIAAEMVGRSPGLDPSSGRSRTPATTRTAAVHDGVAVHPEKLRRMVRYSRHLKLSHERQTAIEPKDLCRPMGLETIGFGERIQERIW
jgi:hypothetical protein